MQTMLPSEMFLRAPVLEPGRDALLNVVVVRLLAVALMAIGMKEKRPGRTRPGIPHDYRRWPVIALKAGPGSVRRPMNFYVCPKGAVTAEDESFPSGTIAIVETVWRIGGRRRWPNTIFVMKKVSSIEAHSGCHGDKEGWIYATYDSFGRVGVGKSAVNGICRLAVS